MPHTERAKYRKLSTVHETRPAISSTLLLSSALLISNRCSEKTSGLFVKTRTVEAMMTSKSLSSALVSGKKKSKSFRIAPDGHWQARPFTDRFGSFEAEVLYLFSLVQGGTNVLLPTRCVDELYVNTAYPRGVSRVRELVP